MKTTVGDARMLIDGQLRRSASGAEFDNIDPTTEEVIGRAADATTSDLDLALAAARREFDHGSWSRDLELRVACLRQLRKALTANLEELREVLITEAGCPVSLTRGAQVDTALEEISDAIERATIYEWERPLAAEGAGGDVLLRREPRGVVAAITAFNYPLYLNLRKVAHALAAGCVVVLKPSPLTPWSATVLGRIAHEHTDLPTGAFQVITADGTDIAAALTSDPRVDMVTFVGSSAVGRQIALQTALGLKKTVLELGGKSAAIALDDADVATVAQTAAGVAVHAGQGCSRLSRLLVARSLFDETVDAAREAFGSIAVGDPRDESTIQGPQISLQQQQRVLGLIETAKAEGAKAIAGGGVPSHVDRGYFVEPTLLIGAQPESTIAQTEVFGPVVAVIPFNDDDDDAIAIANNSDYGLSGAVMSGDPERALDVARRVRTGQVLINGAHPGMHAPYAGWKQSGLGLDGGVLGFEEHLEVKVIGRPPTAGL
jgi:aldehyde dehydrogenase (NAD+)